jgi:sulfide:quinone oxidoreductase
MKRLLVLGAGTAGTMVVNKLRPRLSDEWQITVIDHDDVHLYQPGYLFLPFGLYRAGDLHKPRHQFIPEGVTFELGAVEQVLPDANQVTLVDGRRFDYDQLVIASGTTPRPDQTPGLDGPLFGDSIHEFYTFEGAQALGEKLAGWAGGRLAVHIVDMPIKCPVAPLEFTFLAEAFFRENGLRDRVEMTYVTPLPGAFTKPVASRLLGGMLEERKIALESDFMVERVDEETTTLVSYDEREVSFDLLVTIPLNMGADFVARSGLGDELNYVPVDKGTLQSLAHENIWAVGDASNIPASKAGSVAHFSVEIFTENFLHAIEGRPMTQRFDGHANCFVESGDGKAMLIDFNYDTEPLPGKYPLPGVGPFSLLKETEVNHWGKLMFRWIYWNALLPGRELPLPALMSMAGKQVPDEREEVA